MIDFLNQDSQTVKISGLAESARAVYKFNLESRLLMLMCMKPRLFYSYRSQQMKAPGE